MSGLSSFAMKNTTFRLLRIAAARTPTHVAQWSEEPIRLRPSDDDEGRLWLEHAFALGPRPAPGDVEQEVVAPIAPCEVLLGVVDYVIGTERSRDVHIRRATDGGHLRSEHLGNLHGERAHASGRTVDQDLLPWS